ncbi:MAG: hypothetical protein Q9178_000484 [Gyalolechia marmorata]
MMLALGRLLSGHPSEHKRPPPSSPHGDDQRGRYGPQKPAPDNMSSWGTGLYQSDVDLDMLDLIAEEAVKMMSDPECLRSSLMPEFFTLRAPIDRPAAVEQLEGGVLHRLIRRFNHQKNQGAIVILGVVCMELGVKFNPEDRLSINMALMRWDMHEKKRDQVCQAFESYQNNGAVWRFDGKKVMETVIGPEHKVAEAKGKEVVHVKREANVEDAITPVPSASHIRTKSEPAVNAKYNAQLAQLEKILIESDPQPPARAAVSAAQGASKEERITFWLPSTKSQLDLTMQEDRKIDQRKPGESMFTLPARGSSKAVKEDKIDHPESIYRLPAPRPMRKAKGKEVKWKEVTTKEHKKKPSSGKKE